MERCSGLFASAALALKDAQRWLRSWHPPALRTELAALAPLGIHRFFRKRDFRTLSPRILSSIQWLVLTLLV